MPMGSNNYNCGFVGIMTESEKGHEVLQHGHHIDFPFTLTTKKLGKRNKLGRFLKAPTSTEETEYQDFFLDECRHLPEVRVNVQDTHKIPILKTRKPDCVGLDKSRGLDSLNV